MRPTGSLGKRFYQVEYGYAVKEAEVLSMFDGSMVGCRKLCVDLRKAHCTAWGTDPTALVETPTVVETSACPPVGYPEVRNLILQLAMTCHTSNASARRWSRWRPFIPFRPWLSLKLCLKRLSP